MEGFQKAIEYFNLALSEEPNYALAHAGLADSYRLMAFWGYPPVSEAIRKAEEAALKALAIDDTLAEAHFSLGGVRFMKWNWLSAQDELRRAIALNPSYAQAHVTYANYLLSIGRVDEALREATRARQLDPISTYINTLVAAAFIDSGRNDEAIVILQEVLEIDPDFFLAHLHLWRALALKGDDQGACRQAETTFSLMGNREVAEAIRTGYAKSGYKSAMKAGADRLVEQLQQSPVLQYSTIAVLYAHAGEKEDSFRWLERAYEERDPAMIFVRANSVFELLRPDPRFQGLMRRMDFPQ
jgi:tetratricopeptide (TPR) repeat protein